MRYEGIEVNALCSLLFDDAAGDALSPDERDANARDMGGSGGASSESTS